MVEEPDRQFSFRGRPRSARDGETLLSALSTDRIPLLHRSIQYHRPQGPLCGIGHCTGCLVRVNGRPNVRACRYEPNPGRFHHDRERVAFADLGPPRYDRPRHARRGRQPARTEAAGVCHPPLPTVRPSPRRHGGAAHGGRFPSALGPVRGTLLGRRGRRRGGGRPRGGRRARRPRGPSCRPRPGASSFARGRCGAHRSDDRGVPPASWGGPGTTVHPPRVPRAGPGRSRRCGVGRGRDGRVRCVPAVRRERPARRRHRRRGPGPHDPVALPPFHRAVVVGGGRRATEVLEACGDSVEAVVAPEKSAPMSFGPRATGASCCTRVRCCSGPRDASRSARCSSALEAAGQGLGSRATR